MNDIRYMRKSKDRNESAVFILFIIFENKSAKISQSPVLRFLKRPIRTYGINRKLARVAARILQRRLGDFFDMHVIELVRLADGLIVLVKQAKTNNGLLVDAAVAFEYRPALDVEIHYMVHPHHERTTVFAIDIVEYLERKLLCHIDVCRNQVRHLVTLIANGRVVHVTLRNSSALSVKHHVL